MITVLCGGFGAARFVGALASITSELCCVVNVGDDFEYLGLQVCPDLDSVFYALAGCFDESRGWGPVDDSFNVNTALARYGDDWFRLGDRDLALSLKRTNALRQGATLSEATADLARSWAIQGAILPMTNESVRTRVRTSNGVLDLQDFLVRERARPQVVDVSYDGISSAVPAPGLLEAINTANLLIIAPSNPVSSIGPILAVDGIRRAVAARRNPTVAVSPVVMSTAPTTEAERARCAVRGVFMASVGLAHRPSAVATLYEDLIDGFVVDHRDAASEQFALASLGVSVLSDDTLASAGAPRLRLAARVVEFGRGLPVAHRQSRVTRGGI